MKLQLIVHVAIFMGYSIGKRVGHVASRAVCSRPHRRQCDRVAEPCHGHSATSLSAIVGRQARPSCQTRAGSKAAVQRHSCSGRHCHCRGRLQQRHASFVKAQQALLKSELLVRIQSACAPFFDAKPHRHSIEQAQAAAGCRVLFHPAQTSMAIHFVSTIASLDACCGAILIRIRVLINVSAHRGEIA